MNWAELLQYSNPGARARKASVPPPAGCGHKAAGQILRWLRWQLTTLRDSPRLRPEAAG
jgi:hypothetical protein